MFLWGIRLGFLGITDLASPVSGCWAQRIPITDLASPLFLESQLPATILHLRITFGNFAETQPLHKNYLSHCSKGTLVNSEKRVINGNNDS